MFTFFSRGIIYFWIRRFSRYRDSRTILSWKRRQKLLFQLFIFPENGTHSQIWGLLDHWQAGLSLDPIELMVVQHPWPSGQSAWPGLYCLETMAWPHVARWSHTNPAHRAIPTLHWRMSWRFLSRYENTWNQTFICSEYSGSIIGIFRQYYRNVATSNIFIVMLLGSFKQCTEWIQNQIEKHE